MKHCTLVSTISSYLNLSVIMNRSHDTMNRVLYQCIFSDVNRLERINNQAVN